eukprot:4586563-Pleurochrysis_carterae.AAC.1
MNSRNLLDSWKWPDISRQTMKFEGVSYFLQPPPPSPFTTACPFPRLLVPLILHALGALVPSCESRRPTVFPLARAGPTAAREPEREEYKASLLS